MQPEKELQLDLKTNNTQNYQKIELYGSPTTKDLKKPHSFRWVGGVEMQRWVERHRDMVWHRDSASEWAVPHSHVIDKNQEGYLESGQSQPQARPHRLGFQCQEDKSL